MAASKRSVSYASLRLNALGLPRLPIPSLEDTARRYAASVRALKKKSTIDAHLAKLDAFVSSDGPRIQQKLLDKNLSDAEAAGYPHSYIESIWDDAYLKYRGPSPINIAPGIVLKDIVSHVKRGTDASWWSAANVDDSAKPDAQAHVAAHFLHAMLRFAYKMKTVGVEVGDPPSDVSQMANQFGFTRVPRQGGDGVLFFPLQNAMGHVVVLHRGRLFKLNTRDEAGNYYTPTQLAVALRDIVRRFPAEQPELAVGAMTGGSRDDWSHTRKLLETESPVNAANLHDIDSAFTVLCLDCTPANDDPQRLLLGALGGFPDGPSTSSATGVSDDVVNRWYDKHQIIVNPEGRVLCNYEHAFSDGMTWVRWKSEVLAAITGEQSGYSPLPPLPTVARTDPSHGPAPLPLEWHVGDKNGPLGVALTNASRVLSRLVCSVHVFPVRLPVGKADAKKCGISPDALCQAAYLLSYYRLHDRLAPTYESCSTARFWHGRTETIRSATSAVYDLCTADEMLRSTVRSQALSSERRDTLRGMIKAASDKHVELAREAAAGQGVDRHLLALRHMCKLESSAAGLAFFNEPLYEFSGTWLLSTSNVSQPFIDFFDFGPVVGHGYGIGYSIEDSAITATVSAFIGRETDARALANEIPLAVQDLLAVFGTTRT